ncbi:hypothetical protein BM221_007546 [Beauveria bassiana]|uniref:Uncharacterized protein n=1 Tax=Beauveria bassiana TaxID=176275 RepID=A0A2N6NH32_BEABA|nr:hypothetical protein BM221_007546 [Beauveria bassiana]
MASSSFRDSINSLGWSRATEEPVNTSRDTGLFSSIQNLNPFQDRGYLQLPTHETSPGAPLPASSRREEEEGWFIPSFAAVMGPMNYVYHLLSTPRLPFTAAYFGSIIMTLAFAIKLFPNGSSRSAPGDDVWGQASDILDEWLTARRARGTSRRKL